MTDTVARAQGRPKDLEKRAAILEAGRKLFLGQGFDRTSMDAIAAMAGVSKLTVYSHFEDKEGLLRACVTQKCEEAFGAREFVSLAKLGAEQALRRVAEALMSLILDPDVVALYRILIGGANQNADLCKLFYSIGPAPTGAAMAELLATLHESGELEVPDPRLAAAHLFSMLRGELHMRALFNLDQPPSARALESHIDDCLAVFLRAYARRGA
jgi:TetR/AcrR family transcriptional regulator, mexJK operon transcriptional repressor